MDILSTKYSPISKVSHCNFLGIFENLAIMTSTPEGCLFMNTSTNVVKNYFVLNTGSIHNNKSKTCTLLTLSLKFPE